MTDSDETRRKRLLYRSRYTGTKETDELLGRFAEAHLPRMTAVQLDLYERLIENADPDLYQWITGRVAPPAEWDSEILAALRAFRATAGGSGS